MLTRCSVPHNPIGRQALDVDLRKGLHTFNIFFHTLKSAREASGSKSSLHLQTWIQKGAQEKKQPLAKNFSH